MLVRSSNHPFAAIRLANHTQHGSRSKGTPFSYFISFSYSAWQQEQGNSKGTPLEFLSFSCSRLHFHISFCTVDRLFSGFQNTYQYSLIIYGLSLFYLLACRMKLKAKLQNCVLPIVVSLQRNPNVLQKVSLVLCHTHLCSFSVCIVYLYQRTPSQLSHQLYLLAMQYTSESWEGSQKMIEYVFWLSTPQLESKTLFNMLEQGFPSNLEQESLLKRPISHTVMIRKGDTRQPQSS